MPITYRDRSTVHIAAANIGMTMPATWAVGDILLVYLIAKEGKAMSAPAGGGWTLAYQNLNYGTVSIHFFVKAAVSGDTDVTHQFTMDSGWSAVTGIMTSWNPNGADWGVSAVGVAEGTVSPMWAGGLWPTRAKTKYIVFGSPILDTRLNMGANLTERFDLPALAGQSDYWHVAMGERNHTTLNHTGDDYIQVEMAGDNVSLRVSKLLLWYNTAPTTPGLTSPNGGETVDANHTITWTAATDADGDTLVYDIDLTTNGGTSWSRIVTGASGTSQVHDFSAQPASTACRIRIRARDTDDATSAWDESDANFTIQHNVAPSAPSLLTLGGGGNGAVVDLSGGVAADWAFNDPDAGDTQSAWALKRKVGAGADEWWNVATSAWQSTEVFNTSSTTDYVFPTGAWSNGVTYSWTVATKDELGETGAYASYFSITGGYPPVMVLTGPSGTVTDTSRPVLSWTYSDAEGTPQAQYEVKVFDLATYSAGGFNPASASPTWSTGIKTSATDRNQQVGVDLTNSQQYRAYGRVKDGAGQWSAWVHTSFTMSLTPPEAPSIVVTAHNDTAAVVVTVTGGHSAITFPDTVFRVEFSDDNGETWAVLRRSEALVPNGMLQADATDYEAPPQRTRLYRAFTLAKV